MTFILNNTVIEENKTDIIDNVTFNNNVQYLQTNEMLRFIINNGIIDINDVWNSMENMKREELLKQHPYRKWQGKDGKWRTYLPDEHSANNRRLVKRKSEKSIDNCIVDYYVKLENEPYFKDVFKQWIENKMKHGEIQKQTYDRYYNDFDKFICASELNKIKFKDITENMLEDFIKTTIYKNNMSTKGWGNLRTLLNGVFKYGKKKGYTTISITHFMGDLEISKKMFKRKMKSDDEEVFTDGEVKQIINYIAEQPSSAINLGIMLAFQTGLRAGEIASLSYSDFDINKSIIYVTKTEVHYKDNDGHTIYDIRDAPKTEAGFREVIINDEVIDIYNNIRKINPFGEYLFMDSKGKRINGYSFSHKLYSICKKLGIKPKSLHKARKTYATKLINSNVNERLIMQQMGHKDISTTRKYYSFDNLTKEEKQIQIQDAISY